MKWVELDHAEAKAKQVLTIVGAHCDLHAAKPGGAPVELCLTETGGHSWPGGGSQQGAETTVYRNQRQRSDVELLFVALTVASSRRAGEDASCVTRC